jgi:hypothetical protein
MTATRTAARRFFLVLFVALLAGSNIYAAQVNRVLHPTIWYFWAADGKGFDIRQPDGRLIVDQDILPSACPTCARSVQAAWEQRCSGKPSLGWRDVRLCNTGDYSGGELNRRMAYFRRVVDKEYSRYWAGIAARHVLATVVAIGLWVGALGVFGIGAWIRGGPRGAQH